MKSWLRSAAKRVRAFVQAPTLARMDELQTSSAANADRVASRIDEIDAMIQTFEGRLAAAVERSTSQVETNARLAKRLAEIERLLAVPGLPRAETGTPGES